jgi:DNA-binding IclR family transcriptional regulator
MKLLWAPHLETICTATNPTVSTSDRLLKVLGLFTAERPQWTVEGAAAELKLAVSTAYRYFRSLSQAGLIIPYANGRYVLGPAIIQYDRQLRLHDPLISVSAPLMKQLAPVLPRDCLLLLCRLYGERVMCVHQEYLEMPTFAVSFERGRPMPLSRGAASKVILANMPARFLRSFHARHAEEMRERLGSDWNEVRARLREIRAQGVHVTQSELDTGMMGIAAPLFEPDGSVVGSISVVLPARLGTAEVVEHAATLMRAAGAQIGASLEGIAGGAVPADTGATITQT